MTDYPGLIERSDKPPDEDWFKGFLERHRMNVPPPPEDAPRPPPDPRDPDNGSNEEER